MNIISSSSDLVGTEKGFSGQSETCFLIRQQHDYRKDAIILQKPKTFEVEEFPYDTANNELFS